MKRAVGFLFLVGWLFAGCAAHAVHPGAANKFDSDSYDAVLVTHNLIETTKTDLANNAFPASIAGNVKTALNDLIKSYDIADTAYTTYHTAALAGNATAAQQTALTNALTTVSTSTAALTAAKAAK
jgi:hypothetical protein